MSDTKCTVVIPEHNRPLHLKRLLDFYLKYDINIIVSDSSDSEFLYIQNYTEKIVYRHYPKMPLAEKINAIGPFITTPYVFMCANDDFIVPETAHNIISFLENNMEYNSGQGIYVKFDPVKDDITPLLLYDNMLTAKADEIKCTDRFTHLMGNYYQFYYAVFRTETFNKIYNSVIIEEKTVIKNLRLLEIYISCYSVIEGKHIVLQEFYGARESIFMSAGAVTDTMYHVVNSDNYRDEYRNFIKLLAELISEKENKTNEESGTIIINAVSLYLNKYYPRKKRIKYSLLKLINNKILAIFGRNIYLQKKNQSQKTIPAHITGMDYWEGIKQHILDYRFIYL
jgi:glycosyltransferase domain-containing protein